jgi:hypothetical protein
VSHRESVSADSIRQKPRCTVTLDPQVMAKLDLESGPRNRSAMVEVAVRSWLELLERVRAMKRRYENAAKTRRVPAGQ